MGPAQPEVGESPFSVFSGRGRGSSFLSCVEVLDGHLRLVNIASLLLFSHIDHCNFLQDSIRFLFIFIDYYGGTYRQSFQLDQ
jgi:hypothetical protein